MKGLLSVRNLQHHYRVRQRSIFSSDSRPLKAVDGISFEVPPGEMFGIVGESGCGKSTTARLLLGHLPATSGDVFFSGERVSAVFDANWRRMRRRMQMVYQDPLSALDPRIMVARQIEEPLLIHMAGMAPAERRERAACLMADVGLSDHHGERFPHELSGGQRQRVIIARALAVKPELIVFDEPVSALDVSVQAQVLNVLEDIRARTSFTGVFISHDLKVVRQVADRVAVMYLGKIVELAPAEEIFAEPAHPYTRALVSAVPAPRRGLRKRILLNAEPPNPLVVPSGCPFHTRCPEAQSICRSIAPKLLNHGRRAVACHLVSDPTASAGGAA